MKICNLADIKDGSAQQFELNTATEIFIVRIGRQVYGYINSCPHTGAPLNWLPGQFLDVSQTYIQCSGHDALFRITDGLCLHGPCLGQSLTNIELKVSDNEIYGPASCCL